MLHFSARHVPGELTGYLLAESEIVVIEIIKIIKILLRRSLCVFLLSGRF
jgi:hypothetical protein